MPLNTLTPSMNSPRTLPETVSAIGASVAAGDAAALPARIVTTCLLGDRKDQANTQAVRQLLLALNDRSEQRPLLSGQPHQLCLAERRRAGRSGVDCDAG